MAIKRYPLRYVKTYKYQDESGNEEDIVFMANGFLFPLFKSYVGVELTKALTDYKKGLLNAVTKETLEVVAKYEAATNPDEKVNVILNNPETVVAALQGAQSADTVNGLSLIDALLIVMRVCAIPESDHAEALALGTELIPQECFEDPQLALELLNLAIQYEDKAKKNFVYRRGR